MYNTLYVSVKHFGRPIEKEPNGGSKTVDLIEALVGAILVVLGLGLHYLNRAVKDLTIELTTARWEYNQRERLKAERYDKDALTLLGKFADQ